MADPLVPATEAAGPPSGATLVGRYAGFAVLATIVNLAVQNILLAILSGPAAIYAAIGAGSIAGLALKFELDRRWIFYDAAAPARETGGKFAVYTLFGVLTTGVFWGVELVFHYVFGGVLMTNVGAVLGLAIGYVLKYWLDKRVTFRKAQP